MSAARRLLLLALVLVLLGGSGSAVAATRDKALTAPAKVGPYIRDAAVKKYTSGPGLKLVQRYAAWSQKTAAAISAAYGGAPALMERYADESLETSVALYAVRAPSPKLWAPYADAAWMGIVSPETDTRTFGDVTCLMQNAPTPRGHKPAKDASIAVRCQRSDAHLTVMIEARGPIEYSASRVSALVDDAWSSLQ
jgi:hypothetical protein